MAVRTEDIDKATAEVTGFARVFGLRYDNPSPATRHPLPVEKCCRPNNDEKPKTTARLTQRDIFKTIFRLARPAFFRVRCY